MSGVDAYKLSRRFTNVRPESADLPMGDGVVLEFASESDGRWLVWGVRIDHRLYRAPRDLAGDLLAEGTMLDALRIAAERLSEDAP